MTDLESIEASVSRVSASLGVLLLDQGPLALANTLDAARDAMGRVRSFLTGHPTPPAELRATIEFLEKLTAMLGPLVAGEPVQR